MIIRPLQAPFRVEPDGTARVGSSRVTLESVIHAYRSGSTAEEIVEQYPALRLADVHGVIAYYLNNLSEVQEYLNRREAEAMELRRESEIASNRQGLRERLRARRVTQ